MLRKVYCILYWYLTVIIFKKTWPLIVLCHKIVMQLHTSVESKTLYTWALECFYRNMLFMLLAFNTARHELFHTEHYNYIVIVYVYFIISLEQRTFRRKLLKPSWQLILTQHDERHKYSCKENQLDAQFILSIFRQSTSTCFGSIYSPSSGYTPYIHNSWYLLFFLVDCLLSWLGWNPNRTQPEQQTVN